MLKETLPIFIILIILLASCLKCLAEEGMWLLDTIDRLPIDSLKAVGLKLNPGEIYDPKGGGIADAGDR